MSTRSSTPKTPLFAEPRVVVDRRDDGTVRLSCPHPLPEPARAVGDWLVRWADAAPQRTVFAERPKPGAAWRTLGYAEALASVRAIGSWILRQRFSAERPVAILSDNGVDHALVALAAQHVGVPSVAISPAYSLLSKDHAKLKAMIALLEPGAIYVADEAAFAGALAAIEGHGATLIASRPAREATAFEALLAETDDAAVDAAFAAIGPDTIAKFLFTSGSTGAPKAVVNTQRMLTSNQAARVVIWPFLREEPPVIVDWLPWSHTFGGNNNFYMTLATGGTLYVDAGKPAPHLVGITIDNITDVAPTIAFNVPRGFDMLTPALRENAHFRERFFENLRLILYAGAALPQNVWHALEELAVATTGRKVPMISSWGSTETAPLATDCYFQADKSGNIGLPAPGVTLKLVPNAGKYEIRVHGPNVTPGYWKQPELTEKAFDEEGFYKIGDAVKFADPERPEQGLFFDGRVSEDFKLSSGTWVSVGDLRVSGIAVLAPLAQDIVVTGHQRDAVGFLVFANPAGCREIAGAGDDVPLAEVLATDAVRAHLAAGLRKLKAAGGGSSRFAARARLMVEPPAVDAGEITDKGYINQRAVLARRTAEIEALYGDDPGAFVEPA